MTFCERTLAESNACRNCGSNYAFFHTTSDPYYKPYIQPKIDLPETIVEEIYGEDGKLVKKTITTKYNIDKKI